jgi:hypothetical protein
MLQPGASQEEIKQAYHDLVTVWHPDRYTGNPRLQRKAQTMLRMINEAYTRLQAATPPEPARAAPPPRRAARKPQPSDATFRPQLRPVGGGLSLEAALARLPMPEIIGGLIVLAALIVVAVVALAIYQLTTSPVPVALSVGTPHV